jgi:APA family basic amino acid/polyamine antiporter
VVNVPAMLIVVLTCGLLLLGMRESARSNNVMVALKLLALVLFVGVGAFFITRSNWEPFVPPNTGDFGDFGVSGVVRAAGVVFFAYIGFDAVSTAAAEARRPKTTIPIGLIGTVLIATTLYIAIGIVMTGMAPYGQLNVADPLAVAVHLASPKLGWLETLIDLAAVIGLAATTLVTFYGQTRIFMRMSADGMLPDRLGRVSPKRQTPVVATVVCAVGGALVAGLTPITALSNLVSIGTLLSFVIVCGGVLVLRKRRPDLERPFRVPAVWITAPFGIVCAVGLIATLPISTWIRLVVWLLIGLTIYFAYAKPRSTRRMAEVVRSDAGGDTAGVGADRGA